MHLIVWSRLRFWEDFEVIFQFRVVEKEVDFEFVIAICNLYKYRRADSIASPIFTILRLSYCLHFYLYKLLRFIPLFRAMENFNVSVPLWSSFVGWLHLLSNIVLNCGFRIVSWKFATYLSGIEFRNCVLSLNDAVQRSCKISSQHWWIRFSGDTAGVYATEPRRWAMILNISTAF